MKMIAAGLCVVVVGAVAFTAALVRQPPAPPRPAQAEYPVQQERFAGAADTLSPSELRRARMRNKLEMAAWHQEQEATRRSRGPRLPEWNDAEYQRWRERVLPTPRNAFPRVGACYATRVKWIGGRIGELGELGSGTAILFENALYQVSYDDVPAIRRSRAGDEVRTCVVSLPKGCPKGDFRGVDYRTVNQRTHEHWILADSAHMCGGL
jgi:hypothetical protein